MRNSSNISPLDLLPRDDDKRHKGRLSCELLQCNLGKVLDISASGLRVRRLLSPGFVGSTVVVQLQALEGPGVLVKARVVWNRRRGMRVETGLEFVELPPEASTRLTRMIPLIKTNLYCPRGQED